MNIVCHPPKNWRYQSTSDICFVPPKYQVTYFTSTIGGSKYKHTTFVCGRHLKAAQKAYPYAKIEEL